MCVPKTSVWMKSPAARIERSTWVSAAKLTIASQPSAASATAPGSPMSPWTKRCSTPSRFAGFPEYVSLSSTTTSSPPRTSRFTKCEPMNPAPPVTRIAIGRSLVPQAAQTVAEALAPVEQLGCALLSPEHRVGRSRREGAELGRRDSANPAGEPGLLEDRLGELRPRAVPAGRDVIGALRKIEHVARRLGEV